MTGYGSGRLPKQNVGENLGEARAAQWVNEQEETRRRERATASAGQPVPPVTHNTNGKKKLARK